MGQADWKISITSFNCGKALPYDKVSKLTPIIEKLIPDDQCNDICVLGFQELTEIWMGSFPDYMELIFDNIGKCAQTILGNVFGIEYQVAASNHLGTLGLVILTKKSIDIGQKFLTSCKRGQLGSSLKGGAAISIDLKDDTRDDTFIFICNHLAANKGKFNERIDDYNHIMSHCDSTFRMRTLQSSHLFFFGDLNFRSNKPIYDFSESAIIEKVLTSHDELNILKQENMLFQGFEEAKINFPPTYKYSIKNTKSNEYSTKRIPSWCDRIFYRHYKTPTRTKYFAIPRTEELRFTDHQPVNLTIEVQLGVQDIAPIQIRKQYGSSIDLSKISDPIIGYGDWFIQRHPIIGSIMIVITLVLLYALLF
ncbi:hypothetical protein TBLA_0F00890 [Henningerozyma blattae CBS 6284]|uniref:Inositol polyphosphate-related phosphatase domain-containing protein n=1 Tax=Henningerozyma blattae (strain ATCC 34711 / CBS 6284 / DSM 70876 / NBRC 10599 / NRRL Y-10934 / UCD 77-7) TaxID=1071380 RepID=I2H5I1_HENB6|nr:hypothetical protein TBLA_0F00890 [Tetrapisispora blattae CBS 6284]CCH61633.1 hypothetical protein TBLA_0F00890 [Tetrapisispora blattae CBS 6284]